MIALVILRRALVRVPQNKHGSLRMRVASVHSGGILLPAVAPPRQPVVLRVHPHAGDASAPRVRRRGEADGGGAEREHRVHEQRGLGAAGLEPCWPREHGQTGVAVPGHGALQPAVAGDLRQLARHQREREGHAVDGTGTPGLAGLHGRLARGAQHLGVRLEGHAALEVARAHVAAHRLVRGLAPRRQACHEQRPRGTQASHAARQRAPAAPVHEPD